jgi:hypothetical protein
MDHYITNFISIFFILKKWETQKNKLWKKEKKSFGKKLYFFLKKSE